MNLEEGFFDDIRHSPDDDTGRLAYADWLEERGQPGDAERAEYVRLCCELAALPMDERRRQKLRLRERRLRPAILEQCRGWLPDRAISNCRFRNGLLDTITCDLPTFAGEGQTWLRRSPLRRLRLRVTRDQIPTLTQMPHLRSVPILEPVLYRTMNRPLIRIPWFLEPIGELLTALAGCPLPRLRIAVLLDHPVPDTATLHALLALGLARQCESLEVRGISYSPPQYWFPTETLQEFCSCADLANLRALELVSMGVGDNVAATLADCPHLANLRRLSLQNNPIGDAGVIALARSPYLGELRELSLAYSAVGEAGASALAESTHLAKLRCVNLADMNRRLALGLRTGADPIGTPVQRHRWRHGCRCLRRLQLRLQGRFGPLGQVLHY